MIVAMQRNALGDAGTSHEGEIETNTHEGNDMTIMQQCADAGQTVVPDYAGPAWATSRELGEMTLDDLPLISWGATLHDSPLVKVDRTRIDVYDPSTGDVDVWQPESVQIFIGGTIIDAHTLDELREIAAALTAAADAWDAAS